MAVPTWGLCFAILEFLEQRELMEGNTFGRVLDDCRFFLAWDGCFFFFCLRSCWSLFEIGEICI